MPPQQPPQKLTTITIEKQYLHFSIAHFTIFSATERERLHGHNVRIAVEITGAINDNGLCFDYAIYKNELKALCARFDEYTLIAEQSPHLTISEEGDYYHVVHNGVDMPLLKTDTLLLPIRNITIEELSHYLLGELLGDFSLVNELEVQSMTMRVSSGSNQWASAHWERD